MVKTITIRDDVYYKLLAIKGNESFSDLLERLIEERGVDLLKKIREKANLTKEEKERMLKAALSKRGERRSWR